VKEKESRVLTDFHITSFNQSFNLRLSLSKQLMNLISLPVEHFHFVPLPSFFVNRFPFRSGN